MATVGPNEFEVSKRLSGPETITAITSGTAQTLFTVPAGKKAKLKNIQIANTGVSTRSFSISIGADAAGTRLFSVVDIAKNTVLTWEGEIVLSAAETLRAFASAASDLTITTNGSEITL